MYVLLQVLVVSHARILPRGALLDDLACKCPVLNGVREHRQCLYSLPLCPLRESLKSVTRPHRRQPWPTQLLPRVGDTIIVITNPLLGLEPLSIDYRPLRYEHLCRTIQKTWDDLTWFGDEGTYHKFSILLGLVGIVDEDGNAVAALIG